MQLILGFFLRTRLVAFLLLILLAGAGVLFAPFEWNLGGIERSAVQNLRVKFAG